jgi:gluconolactonase
LFAPPPAIEARILARVPQELRVRGRVSDWSQTHRRDQPCDCFLEGPSFDRSGNLYLVDVAWGRILRMDPAGGFSIVAQYDGAPNGLKLHADGRVFRRRASGQVELLLDRVPSPNGLVLDHPETTLFVNVTRDNAVWRVPLLADGTACKVGAFVRLSGGIGPDGLAIDAAGNLAIAHIGLGAVWLVASTGEPLIRINSPAGKMTTNLAFGGPHGRTLYITESESGSILTAEMPVAGRPMFSHHAQGE